MESFHLSVLTLALGLAGFVDLGHASAQNEIRDVSAAQVSGIGVDLAHGDRQVAQMLTDRPLMSRYLSNHILVEIDLANPIWIWAATAYGTKINDLPIKWDATEEQKWMHIKASHMTPQDGKCGLIRVRKRVLERDGIVRNATFESLWSGCIYELFNMQNADGFIDIRQRALLGKVSRREYVRSNAMLEHVAVLKLDSFYDTVWKPWADANGYTPDPSLWFGGAPKKYDDWILLYRNAKHDPRDPWEEYYDQYIVPYTMTKQF